MMNTIAIVMGAITALGSCGAASCKYYEECHRKHETETVVPPTRPNTPVPNLQEMIEQVIKEDEDVSIKINIHTHHNKNQGK
jgi:hypothetical protein